MDYRQVSDKFDRIVSVGMFEHVGRKFYKKFFKKVGDILKEDGIALLHTIGSVDSPRNPQPWITKYIFPGGYTPSLSEVASPIEKSGLILSDLEVLRMHYAHTLRNWKERFLKNKEKVLSMFDEKFSECLSFICHHAKWHLSTETRLYIKFNLPKLTAPLLETIFIPKLLVLIK